VDLDGDALSELQPFEVAVCIVEILSICFEILPVGGDQRCLALVNVGVIFAAFFVWTGELLEA